MNHEEFSLLLVEDNEDDIVLAHEALQDANLINRIEVVRDGEAALAFLRQKGAYSESEPVGLVLCDINMPKKNGFELLQEMKRDHALCHIPVIMLTVSEREEDVLKAYSFGACSYIRKPVTFSKFAETMKHFAIYWALVATLPLAKL
ncbi:MAG TPA: response regulator [Planctomycetota bacterium]|nr:response regulator [Planctomycetota bacterium]